MKKFLLIAAFGIFMAMNINTVNAIWTLNNNPWTNFHSPSGIKGVNGARLNELDGELISDGQTTYYVPGLIDKAKADRQACQTSKECKKAKNELVKFLKEKCEILADKDVKKIKLCKNSFKRIGIKKIFKKFSGIKTHVPITIKDGTSNKSFTKVGDYTSFSDYIKIIFYVISIAAASIAVIRIIIAGIMYSGSAFDITSKEKARDIIKEVIGGITLIFLSGVLLYIINPGVFGG